MKKKNNKTKLYEYLIQPDAPFELDTYWSYVKIEIGETISFSIDHDYTTAKVKALLRTIEI